MLPFIAEFARNTWSLVAQMAPYLLIGFAVAGVLHLVVRKEIIQRWLGKPGLGGVVKASILGVPMPLCSCSVIPVAASLRKNGASRGATASFLSSTPQTGVDSIVATYALLGGVFTAVRVAVAFVCGLVTGYLIELFSKEKPRQLPYSHQRTRLRSRWWHLPVHRPSPSLPTTLPAAKHPSRNGAPRRPCATALSHSPLISAEPFSSACF